MAELRRRKNPITYPKLMNPTNSNRLSVEEMEIILLLVDGIKDASRSKTGQITKVPTIAETAQLTRRQKKKVAELYEQLHEKEVLTIESNRNHFIGNRCGDALRLIGNHF